MKYQKQYSREWKMATFNEQWIETAHINCNINRNGFFFSSLFANYCIEAKTKGLEMHSICLMAWKDKESNQNQINKINRS